MSLTDHSRASVDKFHIFVETNDQVLECSSITGDFDYILKVAATDTETLDYFITHNIFRFGVVRTTTTTITLRQMKVSGVLPVDG